MKTCPKCGSPQESPKLDGTTARIWFTCGSYGYADKPDQVFRSSDKCLDREEINTLQRKVEELQVALDNLQASTIHSCGDSCSRPMCVLRRERDAYKESLKYIHSICEDKTIELPDDDYAKVTIDECIMEAERAMQKCKKMEGEAK